MSFFDPTSSEYQKTPLVLNFTDVATHFSPKNKSQFFYLGLNQKPPTCSGVLQRRVRGFLS